MVRERTGQLLWRSNCRSIVDEEGLELAVPVADQEPGVAAGVLEVHDEVACGLPALEVIDAIWSAGTRYPNTRGVIGRHRSRREWERGDATQDSLTDMLGLYERLGGVDQEGSAPGSRPTVQAATIRPMTAMA